MRTRYLLLTICSLAGAGCDDFLNVRAPTASEVPRVDGVWRGTDTITSVALGDCAGPAMQSRVGAVSALQLAIQQDGINLSGTNTQPDDGTACPVAGSFFGSSAFNLNTPQGACDARSVMAVTCPNGDVRDLKHVADSLVPLLEGDVMTGHRTVRYDVYAGGASNRLAELIVSSRIRLERE